MRTSFNIMPKKPIAKKKPTPKKKTTTQSKSASLSQKNTNIFILIRQRIRDLLARRPHRSFRQSRRRDYIRSLQLPGYWAFTNQVRKTLWTHKKLLLWIVVVYGLLSAIFVGLASQDTYTALSDTLRDTSGDLFTGNIGELGKASLLLLTGVTGSLNTAPTETQQIYASLLGLLTWLTTVWLLRSVLAGQKPRFRDGLYNAGAPLVSTFLVALVIVVQLLPAALSVIGFSAAISSGFLEGGVEAMIFAVLAILLIVLSVYWITSTLIALVVVTLPSMYPMQALKTAGDLVVGRRLRILLRWAWLAFIVIILWAAIMVPLIIFDTWLKGMWPAVNWLPIIPLALLVMSSFTVVITAAYTYILYRKVVEDDATPA